MNRRPWAFGMRWIVSIALLFTLGAQESRSQTTENLQRVAVGKVVIATAHPLATAAAAEMLRQGGNAVDAAVAAAFTIGVVEPDGSGLGGGGGMLIYMNKEKKAAYINYYQQTGERQGELEYDHQRDRQTAKAALIPGTVAGLTQALEHFGSLPLSVVLEPAIRHAENGFPIDNTLAKIILDNYELLTKYPSTSAIYLDEGFPLAEGDLLVQKDLGQTLRTIAAGGRDGFYDGPVARAIVESVAVHGGVMTLNDLRTFKARLTTPLHGTYRGYEVLTTNLPQSGAAILEGLNILEQADIPHMEHYSRSGETLHIMAEAMRRTYADRSAFIADPVFEDVPADGLTSKAYARERFLDIDPAKATPPRYRDTKPGNPGPYGHEAKPERQRMKGEDGSRSMRGNADDREGSDRPAHILDEADAGGHTTHLVVADQYGNVVSLTQTLGTFFGSGLTTAGVLLNNAYSNFARTVRVNAPAPLKQPRSSISPTILLKDGRPYAALGSPGSIRIIATVLQLIVNIVDYGMTAEEANNAPRFFCQKFDDFLHLESRIGESVQHDLEARGHALQVHGEYDLFFGGAQMLVFNPSTGTYQASADPRRGGAALGF